MYFLEQTKFDLPHDFVNYHTEQRVYKHQLDLLKGGMPLEEIQKQTENIKNASVESVMRELKASLVLTILLKKKRYLLRKTK